MNNPRAYYPFQALKWLIGIIVVVWLAVNFVPAADYLRSLNWWNG